MSPKRQERPLHVVLRVGVMQQAADELTLDDFSKDMGELRILVIGRPVCDVW
jgi:hypothetical protein